MRGRRCWPSFGGRPGVPRMAVGAAGDHSGRMRRPPRLLAALVVLAPLMVGCMTVNDARTEPAGVARRMPVERPSNPSPPPSPVLRLSSPVPEKPNGPEGEHQERERQPPAEARAQVTAPAAEPSVSPRSSAPVAPRMKRAELPSVRRARPTSVPEQTAGVNPAQLCRWGERAGAVSGDLARLCRRTYG